MILFFCAIYSVPNYYIRLANSNQMLCRHQGTVVASDFYSPILFEFTQTSKGDLFLKDIIKKKNLTTSNGNIILERPKGAFSTSFEIVYNGNQNFYIMKDDKCLEVENNPQSPFLTNIGFKKCSNNPNQSWDLLLNGDKKVLVRHAYIPDKRFHMKRHNHIFIDKTNPQIKKHSSFMVYHPEIEEDYNLSNVHDIPLKVGEYYDNAKFIN